METTAEPLEEPLLSFKDDTVEDEDESPLAGELEDATKDDGETAACKRHARRIAKVSALLDRLIWFLPDPSNTEGEGRVPPDPTGIEQVEIPKAYALSNENAGEGEEDDQCVDAFLDMLLRFNANPAKNREERGAVQAVPKDLIDTTKNLAKYLQFLQFWTQKGQFLLLGPIIVVLLAVATGEDQLSCWALALVVFLVPLWAAAVVFPLGGYSDVRFLDLLPMTCLITILCNWGPLPYDDVFTHVLSGCMASFFVLPGSLVAKKVLLKRNPGSLTKVRVASFSFCVAVVSFFGAAVDCDSFFALGFGMTFLQIILVITLIRLGDSPLGCTSLMSVAYPCLMRPIKELEDHRREDQQDAQDDIAQAQLERQYNKLGGRSSRKRHSGYRGEIFSPVIVGLLVFWSIVVLVWHSQTLIQTLLGPTVIAKGQSTASLHGSVTPINLNSLTGIPGSVPSIVLK